ncbi:MAG: hypothetical protein COX77_03700 [Candidatus Komeilibacteria bacterium CG_4_10_14_0_2_um_filter_37_10]|uniref:Uncharacterized protein n=1 Tax=Candidatus Komeilibacteria bacterium CG_4_10_14_0_2_um_filter_37_10 TaxID=1974470 RepID=A0A2M7VEE4_9BACT|nr:MAG: hypothetical protein COX77_03700 [Candidatus Komeilibacteria bacterium CG_4_10_14_0_2_um_filter_37_10]
MKKMILYLLCAFSYVTLAQELNSVVLEKTGWPSNIQESVAQIVGTTAGETVRLSTARQFDGAIIDNSFKSNAWIDIGARCTFWYYQTGSQKALLVKSNNNWYWQSSGINFTNCGDTTFVTSDLPLGGSSSKHSSTSSYSANVEFGYYGQNGVGYVTASRTMGLARYWESHKWENCLFDVGAGWGVDLGGGLVYRPSKIDIKLSEAVPMGMARLHGYLDIWQIKIYSNIGYLYSWKKQYSNNYMEGYVKGTISFTDQIKLAPSYYGAKATVQEWLYNEGRVQVYYLFPENYFIGLESGLATYLDGKYSNYLSPKPGGIVAGYQNDNIFLEGSIGQYNQIDAWNNLRTKKTDVIKFQITCNIKLTEF